MSSVCAASWLSTFYRWCTKNTYLYVNSSRLSFQCRNSHPFFAYLTILSCSAWWKTTRWHCWLFLIYFRSEKAWQKLSVMNRKECKVSNNFSLFLFLCFPDNRCFRRVLAAVFPHVSQIELQQLWQKKKMQMMSESPSHPSWWKLNHDFSSLCLFPVCHVLFDRPLADILMFRYVVGPFCETCCPSKKLVNFITWLGYINSGLNRKSKLTKRYLWNWNKYY